MRLNVRGDRYEVARGTWLATAGSLVIQGCEREFTLDLITRLFTPEDGRFVESIFGCQQGIGRFEDDQLHTCLSWKDGWRPTEFRPSEDCCVVIHERCESREFLFPHVFA